MSVDLGLDSNNAKEFTLFGRSCRLTLEYPLRWLNMKLFNEIPTIFVSFGETISTSRIIRRVTLCIFCLLGNGG